MVEEVEQRSGEAKDPSDRGKPRQTGYQGERQPHLPRPVLASLRQAASEDRDEVDAEYDLERSQRQLARPDLRVGQPIHSRSSESGLGHRDLTNRNVTPLR